MQGNNPVAPTVSPTTAIFPGNLPVSNFVVLYLDGEDSGNTGFSRSTYEFTEGRQLRMEINLSDIIPSDNRTVRGIISVSSDDIDASEIRFGGFELTLKGGDGAFSLSDSTIAHLIAHIPDDVNVEGTETFTVSIEFVYEDTGTTAFTADTPMVTIRILDDDVPASICSRSESVREEILRLIGDNRTCDAVIVEDLVKITELDVSSLDIRGLDVGDFDLLSNLEVLNLSDNPLSDLPVGLFAGLTSLTHLDLTNNNLTTLSAAVFAGLTSLTNLDLHSDRPFYDQSVDLPPGLFNDLTSLTNLDLGGIGSGELPAGIFDNLTSLNHLDLRLNDLRKLPTGIFDNLTSLTFLEVSFNSQLRGLSTAVFDNLASLKSLALRDIGLSEFPAGVFNNLTSLETLLLNRNQLSEVPRGTFDNLTSLDHLDLSNNRLSELPLGIFDKLTSLTYLNLSNNQLRELSLGIFDKLTSLRALELNDNQLSGLPFGIFDRLSILHTIALFNNKITRLPAGIFGAVPTVHLDPHVIVGDHDSNLLILDQNGLGRFLSEGDPAVFRLGLNNIIADTFSVGWRVDCLDSDPGITAADFTGFGGACPSGIAEILSDASVTTITIAVVNDNLLEGLEPFRLLLLPDGEGGTDLPSSVRINQMESDFVRIADLDRGVWRLSGDELTVSEGKSLTFAVTLSTDVTVDEDLLIYWTVDCNEDITAADFAGTPCGENTVTIPAGSVSATFAVSTIEDALLEGDEPFRVRLLGYSSIAGDPLFIVFSFEVFVLDATILDGDMFRIGFEDIASRVSEDEGSVTLTVSVLLGGIEAGESVTVSVNTMDGSATTGSDYTATESVLTFTSEVTTRTLAVGINDDALFESLEEFTVHLTTLLDDEILLVSTAVVTIEDDDVLTMGFVRPYYRVSEDVGSVTLTVSVLSGSIAEGESVTVSVNTMDGSATAGRDYTGIDRVFTFTSEATTRTLSVDINDDALLEGLEVFAIHLTTIRENVAVSVSRALVTVEDEDVLTVGFVQPTYRVVEESGSVLLTVSMLSGGLAEGLIVTVSVSTMDGSATAGSDYIEIDRVLTFTSKATTRTVSVIIKDEALEEGVETFTVHLTTFHEGVMLSPSTAVVTLEDDDALAVGFVQPDYRVLEGPISVTLTVSVIFGDLLAGQSVAVRVSTMDGSATAGSDYTEIDRVLTFTSESTTQTFSVIIKDDELEEGAETFTVHLTSLSEDLRLSSVSRALVIIEDDELENICDRSAQVQEALLASIGQNLSCDAVPRRELASIVNLDLSARGITQLQAGDFDGLTSLTELLLRDNRITTITAATFSDLSALAVLDLHMNGLRDTHIEVFANTPSLIRLDLSFNELGALPEGIFDNLSKLERLFLNNNQFTTLPTGIFDNLSKLKRLLLNNNRFNTLPAEIFDNLSSVTTIEVGYSNLKTLPNGIFSGNTNLRRLILRNNDFSTLPMGIFTDLTSLTFLDLSNNDFVELPAGIFSDLSNLRVLFLQNNDLVTLTSGIFANLRSLTELLLYGNNLMSLPRGLFVGTPNLQTLQIENNKFTNLPDEIFDGLSPSAQIILDSSVILLSDSRNILSILEPSPAEVDEGDSAVFMLALDDVIADDSSVGWRLDCVSSSSGITASDFEGSGGNCPSGIAEIPSGARMTVVTIAISTDNLLEGQESFKLLVHPDGEGGTDLSNGSIVIDEMTSAVVTINDGDRAELSLTSSDVSLSEGSTFTFEVSLVPDGVTADEDITVAWTVDCNEGVTPSDFAGTPCDVNTVKILRGSVSGTFAVSTIEDALLEGRELFTVRLNDFPTARPGMSLNTVLSFAVSALESTILDDDTLRIGFAEPTYRVSEDEGSVTLTVSVLSGSLVAGANVTIGVGTVDGSATKGNDYTDLTDTVLTFTSEAVTQTVSIDINDDASAEGSEIFTVHLTTSSDVVLPAVSRAIVTILDNDNRPPAVVPSTPSPVPTSSPAPSPRRRSGGGGGGGNDEPDDIIDTSDTTETHEPPQPVTISSPNEVVMLETLNGNTPEFDVDKTVIDELNDEELMRSTAEVRPPLRVSLLYGVDVTLRDSAGADVTIVEEALRVCFPITVEITQRVNGDYEKLTIYHLMEELSAWEEILSMYDAETEQVCGNANEFSVYALGFVDAGALLPPTGGMQMPLWGLVLVTLAGVLLIVVGARRIYSRS